MAMKKSPPKKMVMVREPAAEQKMDKKMPMKGFAAFAKKGKGK